MFLKSRRSFAAALVSLLFVSALAFSPRTAARTIPPVEFSLRSIDGSTVSSADVRGQVAVLAFGASWLPLTRKQMQGVRKLANDYSAHGVIV
ncbi:MAG TPA: redoxin domain-containing protein, partial [Pyrinomonadaceae bacterium]|nr:redoxin domain-containing protein [Pyrinomonadaceae bacterium]